MDKDITEARITPFSARFRDSGLEKRFAQDRLSQTRSVLTGIGLLGVFGATIAAYGAYLSFEVDSWVFQVGLGLRLAFILFALAVVATCLVVRNPTTLYTWNAIGLALGCVVMALRMTLPDGTAEDMSLFYVSRDGVMLLLVVAMAELILMPGWFVMNAAILSLALVGFLSLAYLAPPTATEHPLNLTLSAIISFAFILGLANAVQRLRRGTYLVHTRLSEANKRLEQLARTDALTGCANRRHFFELGEIEWERSRRYHRPLSVIVMDIDHFKRVNDRHGHAVGDRVLQVVAAAVQRSLRSGEVLGRIGGEEFAFLLPETDAEGAAVVAERARDRIASLHVPTEADSVTVTASFGVADNVSDCTDFDSLVNRADTMLYEAKHAGRNRVANPPRETNA